MENTNINPVSKVQDPSVPAGKETNAVSIDQQKVILVGIVHSEYAFNILQEELDFIYFSDYNCKIIYKALKEFYQEYHKIPTIEVMLLEIDRNNLVDQFSTKPIKDLCKEIYAAKSIDDTYTIDKAVELIKKYKVGQALKKAFETIKSGKNINRVDVADGLVKALNIEISESQVYKLSDASQVPKVRKEALGDSDGKTGIAIPSMLGALNESLQYGGYQVGTLNLICAPPSVGKTSFLVNEGAHAAEKGFTVLHVFLGDMVKYDAMIRYVANIGSLSQNALAKMSVEDQQKTVESVVEKKFGAMERIYALSYGSGEKTVGEVLEVIKTTEKKNNVHFDMIIIDYADNFKKPGENMYIESGIIYDKLALFGRIHNSVMMVASQPKLSYWSNEIIPMEGAAESSKKQHIVDLMLTMNRHAKGATFGTIFIAKCRRGISGTIIRYDSNWEFCQLAEIDDNTYTQLVNDFVAPSPGKKAK